MPWPFSFLMRVKVASSIISISIGPAALSLSPTLGNTGSSQEDLISEVAQLCGTSRNLLQEPSLNSEVALGKWT
jgi:hypothetical protein